MRGICAHIQALQILTLLFMMLLKSIAISSKNFLTKFLKTVENFDTDMMKCTRLMMKPIIIVKKYFLPPFSAPKTFVHLPIKKKKNWSQIRPIFYSWYLWSIDVFLDFIFDGLQYWSFSVHTIESWLKVIDTRWKIYQHGTHTPLMQMNFLL